MILLLAAASTGVISPATAERFTLTEGKLHCLPDYNDASCRVNEEAVFCLAN
jgi:hypothetical protein